MQSRTSPAARRSRRPPWRSTGCRANARIVDAAVMADVRPTVVHPEVDDRLSWITHPVIGDPPSLAVSQLTSNTGASFTASRFENAKIRRGAEGSSRPGRPAWQLATARAARSWTSAARSSRGYRSDSVPARPCSARRSSVGAAGVVVVVLVTVVSKRSGPERQAWWSRRESSGGADAIAPIGVAIVATTSAASPSHDERRSRSHLRTSADDPETYPTAPASRTLTRAELVEVDERACSTAPRRARRWSCARRDPGAAPVVEPGVDPGTFRFSGGCSAD